MCNYGGACLLDGPRRVCIEEPAWLNSRQQLRLCKISIACLQIVCKAKRLSSFILIPRPKHRVHVQNCTGTEETEWNRNDAR